MLEEFADRVRRRLEAEHDDIMSAVVDGSCADHSAYRELVGEMRGLRAAADIVREILHKSAEFTSESEGEI